LLRTDSRATDLRMVHHLRATGSDADDLAEMSALLHKAVQLLALALDEVVVREEAVLGDVPAMDRDLVFCRVTVSTVAGSKVGARCFAVHRSVLAII
jgi:hypothetical protein